LRQANTAKASGESHSLDAHIQQLKNDPPAVQGNSPNNVENINFASSKENVMRDAMAVSASYNS
jgi:hypothetical protein